MLETCQTKYEQATRFLYGRINFERSDSAGFKSSDFRLDTISMLLKRRGNPQLRYPVVHVAGTKGKGSVVSMLGSILEASGFRVGVYRSPHLESVRERIAIGSKLISELEFCEQVESLRAEIAELDQLSQHSSSIHPPTFFELITAIAFEYFAQRQVDIAVIEVGLGGRLDSTNVCQPTVSVITNIGIDHQAQLGNTKEKIAFEKAGIIKESTPVVCGLISPKPAAVIKAIAISRNAPSFWMKHDFNCRISKHLDSNSKTNLTTTGNLGTPYQMKNVSLSMYGRHQAINATVAIAVAQFLKSQGMGIPNDCIRSGLDNCQVAGRFQIFDGEPTVVLDICHNVLSAKAFSCAIVQRFTEQTTRRTLLFSASRDKKILPMLRLLCPFFDRIVLTQIADNPRACKLDELKRLTEQTLAEIQRDPNCPGPTVHADSDSNQAWQFAVDPAAKTQLLVVCGSAFLVGQMLPIVRNWAQLQSQPT